jgi:hypothetical protein
MTEDLSPDNKKVIFSEFGIWIIVLVVLSVLGGFFMGNQGVFAQENFLFYYFLFIVFNLTYIGFIALNFFYPQLKGKILAYFHNYDYSFINLVFEPRENGVIAKISKSFFLTFLSWHIILLPLLLLQFLFPRQTFLPVAPNVVFPLIGFFTTIFFTIFPAAPGETGILTVINSLIVTPIFRIFKNKKVGAMIALILISASSGYVWLFFHGFVDQGKQVNQVAHFVFGVETGFLTVFTGSIAPAIALHDINLLYYGILDYVGKYEFARYAIPITAFLLWVSFIYVLYYFNKKR